MDSDPKLAKNRLLEILSDGSAGVPVRLPLAKLFTSYFTTTVRGGSPPSRTLEMLGPHEKYSLQLCKHRSLFAW